MQAIILSAGQGKRLGPATVDTPKCLVPVQDQTLLEWQLDSLARCGIDHATLVVGFGAEQVQQLLASKRRPLEVSTRFNPFYSVADNLVSCWMARDRMHGDFVLINGDTLFEPAVLQRLLDSPPAPVTLAMDHKSSYDTDDMKLCRNGDRLLAIGKDLPLDQVDGESIGMILFRETGPGWFRDVMDQAMQDTAVLGQWYLSVVGEMARQGLVRTQSIHGLDWAEVDYPMDLLRAQRIVARWQAAGVAGPSDQARMKVSR